MWTNLEEKFSSVDERIGQLLEQRCYEYAIQVVKSLIQNHKENRSVGSSRAPDPILAHLYNWLGMCYYKAVEFDEAHTHYTTAIEHDSSCAAAYYNRGTVCYRMGNADAAIPDMEEAAKLQADNPEFVLGLKSARELQKNPQQ